MAKGRGARSVKKKNQEEFIDLDDDFDAILAFLEQKEDLERSLDESVENVGVIK